MMRYFSRSTCEPTQALVAEEAQQDVGEGGREDRGADRDQRVVEEGPPVERVHVAEEVEEAHHEERLPQEVLDLVEEGEGRQLEQQVEHREHRDRRHQDEVLRPVDVEARAELRHDYVQRQRADAQAHADYNDGAA